MSRISKQELLLGFGFKNDPFKGFMMESTDYKRIGQVVNMAVSGRAMVSVIGERGIGKSNAVRAALNNRSDLKLVCPYASDVNKLLISDIEQAIILDLSNEKPKRGKEVRARQLRWVLGGASNRANVVLLIEEAHHLHGMTLRSLKRIREIVWMGNADLLTVILVGQSDPMSQPGVSEVRLRSDSVHMEGLSHSEAEFFVEHTVGAAFEKEAITELCRVSGSHNYEDLKALIYAAMQKALFAGRKRVTPDDIADRPSVRNLEDLRKRAGISEAELSKQTGIPQKTVSKLINSPDNVTLPPASQTKRNALKALIEQHQGDRIEEKQQASCG